MIRRKFLGVLGSAAAWPLAASAQQAAIPRIGFVSLGALGGTDVSLAGLRQGLVDRGYEIGRNLILDDRYGGGNLDQVSALIAELLEHNVDVLVTVGTQVSRAAQRATTKVPIVCISGDPVGTKLVASLSSPGGNITGMSLLSGDYSAKWLAFLKEAAPKLRRVGVLQNPGNPVTAIEIENVKQAAPDLGLEVAVLPAGPTELEATLTALQGGSVDGFVVTDDAFFEGALPRLVALAAQKRLPALYGFSIAPKLGGLMSYSADFFTIWRHLAAYVDRILKGALPADLPVEQATEVVLNINLKVAKTLGLTIPQTLLISANEVIE